MVQGRLVLESLQSAVAIATTPEAAGTLVQRFRASCAAAGLPKDLTLSKELEAFAGFQEKRASEGHGDPWGGEYKPLPSYLQQYQSDLADEITEASRDKLSDATVAFYFAVNESSELVRGYDTEDSEMIEAVDGYLNAWLVKQGFINEGGVVYELDSKGEDIKQEAGKRVKAGPEDLAQKIQDKKKGLSAFVQLKHEIRSFSVERVAFPPKAAEPEHEAKL